VREVVYRRPAEDDLRGIYLRRAEIEDLQSAAALVAAIQEVRYSEEAEEDLILSVRACNRQSVRNEPNGIRDRRHPSLRFDFQIGDPA
jgi:hypothetical protein